MLFSNNKVRATLLEPRGKKLLKLLKTSKSFSLTSVQLRVQISNGPSITADSAVVCCVHLSPWLWITHCRRSQRPWSLLYRWQQNPQLRSIKKHSSLWTNVCYVSSTCTSLQISQTKRFNESLIAWLEAAWGSTWFLCTWWFPVQLKSPVRNKSSQAHMDLEPH